MAPRKESRLQRSGWAAIVVACALLLSCPALAGQQETPPQTSPQPPAPLVSLTTGTPEELEHQADVLRSEKQALVEIKERLLATSQVPAVPGAEKALGSAVEAAAQGAAAGDGRLRRALEFLKAGNAKDAEPLFRAVAEERAARIAIC